MSDNIKLNGPEAEPASGGQAKQLIVFVHGYGADGNDLISLSSQFSQVAPEAAFFSPNAPFSCEGSPFGYQWYDVWMQDGEKRLSAIRSTAAIFDDFISEQLKRRNLEAKDLLLIGFSQGTMISLHAAPRRLQPIAGIIGYSGRMEAPELLKDEICSKPPVILIHGDSDELLAVSEMETAAEALRENGVVTEAHIRPNLGHGIDEEGIKLGLDFVKRVLIN